jgi:hypothetical protein
MKIFKPQQSPSTVTRMTRPVSFDSPTSVRKRNSPPMPKMTKAIAGCTSTISATTAATTAYEQ